MFCHIPHTRTYTISGGLPYPKPKLYGYAVILDHGQRKTGTPHACTSYPSKLDVS